MSERQHPSAALMEVTPHIWRWGVPFPNNPLELTYVYLIETPTGVWLIDAGWDADAGWDVLKDSIAATGHRLEDLDGVILTHFHPDHAGLGRRIIQTTGVSVALHPADEAIIEATHPHSGDLIIDRMDRFAERAGSPPVEDSERATLAVGPLGGELLPVASSALFDGELIDGTLRIIHTPGHTPGHCIVVDEAARVVFLGDHLLPRITPNVSSYDDGTGDPLGQYLHSLVALQPYAAAGYRFHPAHEWEIPAPSDRIPAVIAHHRERCLETFRVINAHQEMSCWEIAGRLTWSRSWEEIAAVGMRRAAVGETMAHLQHLESAHVIRAHGQTPQRWTASVTEAECIVRLEDAWRFLKPAVSGSGE